MSGLYHCNRFQSSTAALLFAVLVSQRSCWLLLWPAGRGSGCITLARGRSEGEPVDTRCYEAKRLSASFQSTTASAWSQSGQPESASGRDVGGGRGRAVALRLPPVLVFLASSHYTREKWQPRSTGPCTLLQTHSAVRAPAPRALACCPAPTVGPQLTRRHRVVPRAQRKPLVGNQLGLAPGRLLPVWPDRRLHRHDVSLPATTPLDPFPGPGRVAPTRQPARVERSVTEHATDTHDQPQ